MSLHSRADGVGLDKEILGEILGPTDNMVLLASSEEGKDGSLSIYN
jgi:hypothetical protein